jgi:hypothetical protein
MMRNERSQRRPKSPRVAWSAALVLVLLGAATGCDDPFPPRSLVEELRVLGIVAEPAELYEGETAEVQALVGMPEDLEVEYGWELCLVDEGPDERYACRNDVLGLPEELLAFFELGDTPVVQVNYLGDAETLQETCRAAIESIPEVPDFVELPDCEEGLEVTLRLTVRAEDIEKIAIKRLFFWFAEPTELQRNDNPVIADVLVGGVATRDETVLAVAPGGQLRFQVVVDEDSLETFVAEVSETEEEERAEEVLFSWFTTGGEWDKEVSFSETGRISLDEAGRNVLSVEGDVEPGTEFEVYLVIRDGRGGSDWRQRRVVVVAPSTGDGN